MRFALVALLTLIVGFCAGCQDPAMRSTARRAEQAKKPKERKILTPENSKFHKPRPTPTEPSRESVAALDRAYESTRSVQARTGTAEVVAAQHATRAVEAGLEAGPTLVIWLFDRSQSAQPLVSDAVSVFSRFYDSAQIQQLPQSPEPQLLTVVAAFDQKLTLLTENPTSDATAIKAAMSQAAGTDTGGEKTFAAINEVLQKYADYRMQQGRQVLLIVVTDEAGDDWPQVDKTVELAEKLTIPVYVVGFPAPWGQTNAFIGRSFSGRPSGDMVEQFPTHGPESRYSERVDVAPWGPGYSYQNGDLDVIDSGFGPFGLEWLCRASGGQFLAVRPEGYASRGFGVNSWPTAMAARFDEATVGKYAPDYVSEERYQKLLAENKARKALHEAAKLPAIKLDGNPETRFEKRNEAQTIRQMNLAQQFAAKHAPPIDRVYEVLAQGEGDREKLTNPRWQAEYDLAMGRVTAAKVRIDGYNAMIAALKRGKTFQNEGSSMWILEQNDNIETGSAMQKMADKARMYLNRVIKEHPGTPWAKLAEEELKTPLGWQWTEA